VEVGSEGAGVVPVAESVGIVLWIPANHCDKGEGEEHEDEDNLAGRAVACELYV
jgi:hypothetical protein